MRRQKSRLICLLMFFVLVVFGTLSSEATGSNVIAIIVADNLLDDPDPTKTINASLQYHKDYWTRRGYEVRTTSWSSSADYVALRDHLISIGDCLKGATLIGDLPSAGFVYGDTEGPTNMYYMDLDGTWTDSDGNGTFDEHTAGDGDVDPEIFINRVFSYPFDSPPDITEIDVVNNYFNRVKDYGQPTYQGNAFTWEYVESTVVPEALTWHTNLYSPESVTHITHSSGDLTRQNYMDNVGPDEGDCDYEFVHHCAHGSYDHVSIAPDGEIENTDIPDIWEPKAKYYLFETCNFANYSKWTNEEFMAGKYIFSTDYGYMGVGSSASMGAGEGGELNTNFLRVFFQSLEEGKLMAEALKDAWPFAHNNRDFLFTLGAPAEGGTDWTGGTGDWHTPGNWSGGLPDNTIDAFINNGGTAVITGSAEARNLQVALANTGFVEQDSGSTFTTTELRLGCVAGSEGTYTLTEGNLNATAEFIGYQTGSGTFNQNGGTNTITKRLYIALGAGSAGEYNLTSVETSEGTLSVGTDMFVGYRGTGEFDQNNADVVTSHMYIGYYDESSGTYSQNGGTTTITGNLSLGYWGGSNGEYVLENGDLISYRESIGKYGTAVFTQSGGTNTTLYLEVNSSSTYTLSGGTLNITYRGEIDGLFDFNDGDGTLSVQGGSVDFSDATISNAGSASFSSLVDTLTIFPTDFTEDNFGSFSNAGVVHFRGTDFIVPTGQDIDCLELTIHDPAYIQGSVDGINFTNNVTISNGGSLTWYDGYIENAVITIEETGGTWNGGGYNLSLGEAAEFYQLGGSVEIYNLYCYGDSTYNLSGGNLSAADGITAGRFEWFGGSIETPSMTVSNKTLAMGFDFNVDALQNGSLFIDGTPDTLQGLDNSTLEITNGAIATQNIAGEDFNLKTLKIGTGTSSGTYNLEAGDLNVSGTEYIGHSGTGTFTQSDGTYHYVAGSIVIGFEDAAIGEYNQNGGTCWVNGNDEFGGLYIGGGAGTGSGTYNLGAGNLYVGGTEHIGHSGTGTFTQSDETSHHVVGSIIIGFEGAAVGEYNQNGGTCQVDGNDEFGGFYVGGGAGTTGTYNLSGTAQLDVDGVDAVGAYGTGYFNQTGGIHTAEAGLHVGFCEDSEGKYNLSGGGLSVTGNVYIGDAGTGTFAQTGGIHTVSGNLYIGNAPDAEGTYTLSGGLLEVAGSIYLGVDTGTGDENFRFNWYADNLSASSIVFGNVDKSGVLAMGFDFNTADLVDGTLYGGSPIQNLSKGVLEVTNGATATQNDGSVTLESHTLRVGTSGSTGTMIHSDGTVVTRYLTIGDEAGSTGTYTITGGTLDMNKWAYIGYYGTGIMTQDGGDVDGAPGGNFWLGRYAGSEGTYNMNHGTFSVNDLVVGREGTGYFNQNNDSDCEVKWFKIGHYPTGVGTYDLNGGTLEITGDANIGCLGTGTLNINGGEFTAHNVKVWSKGRLDITSAVPVKATGYLHFRYGAEYAAVSGTQFHLEDADFINESINSSELAGFANTEFIFAGGSETTPLTFEVAGTLDGDLTNDFNLGQLTVGDTSAAHLQLIDAYDNNTGSSNDEYLFMGAIAIETNSVLDINASNIYVDGDVTSTLSDWIIDGRLQDSTIDTTQYLEAIYDNNRTTIATQGIDPAGTFWTKEPATGSGLWTEPGNWNNGVPTSSDNAYINNNGTVVIDADADAKELYVGYGNSGNVEHTDGELTTTRLYLGYRAGSTGAYTITGGNVDVNGWAYVGFYGTGIMTQDGGDVNITPVLWLGRYAGSEGTYNMNHGTFFANELVVGREGTGHFNQNNDSDCEIKWFKIGHYPTGVGTYDLNGGTLEITWDTNIGCLGTGTLNINGGEFTARNVKVWSKGRLDITSAVPVEATGYLHFRYGAEYAAVSGTQFHLEDADFINESRNSSELAGFANTEFIFAGGSETTPLMFEVAGEDIGASLDGFIDNFAIDTLTIGIDSQDTAWLEILDGYDNIIGSIEALYVHNLYINENSVLDMNDLNIYYDGIFVNNGTINNGTPTQITLGLGTMGESGDDDVLASVPEPFTAGLAALGLLGIAGVLRKRIRNN